MVWDIASPDEAANDDERTVVGGRWVLCNKGDVANPKVRARYVATEVNHQYDPNLFAATPPLEAIRLLLSKHSQRAPSNKHLKLGFLDITKAYFNATPTRDLGLPPGSVGRPVRCCYGTRDAGMLWEEALPNA